MILDGTNNSTATSTDGRASADGKKLQGDLNRFLTLLVTQLQNQDPLEPLDANEFTSQLVQFASVEQQIYQNANLEKMLASQRGAQLASSVSYLGHVVSAEGNTLPLQSGKAQAQYSLNENAAQVKIAVRDSKGEVVYATAVKNKTAGSHDFLWDGRGTNGRQLADGAYTFQVEATDREGNKLDVATGYRGRVTGISGDETGVHLDLGGVALPLDDVLSIEDEQKPLTAS